MKNIGKRIEKAREYRDMSRTELGKAVGFPADSAYRRVLGYEKGDRVPKEEMLKEFAKVLNIDYDWFMFDDDLQLGNISYFENNADAQRKKYIKLRLKIEKDIYNGLQRLTDDEIQKVIDMINSHEGELGVSWRNPAYDKNKKK